MSASAEQVCYELDHGSLWIKMSNGRYWKLRRNGAVQRWKRDPFRYRIPVKAGLKVYAEITNDIEIGTFDSTSAAIIASQTDPNTCSYRREIVR